MFAALSTLVELVLVALLVPLMILLLGLPVVRLVRLWLEIASRLSRLVPGLLLASFQACRAGTCPSDGACGSPADQVDPQIKT
jgi:hypothetical protein